jgi:hypothetical protein
MPPHTLEAYMGSNWKKTTKNNTMVINFGEKIEHKFVAGSRHKGIEVEGLTFQNGEVEFADGTSAWALIGISNADGGEHFETGVFTPGGGMAFQSEDNFLEVLKKSKEEVYGEKGYRYRYFPQYERGLDHHVDYDTGWNR